MPLGALPGIAIDWLHVLGATAWVGGLVAMLLCIAAVRAVDRSRNLVSGLVGQFGPFALVASMSVLLSGVVQGGLEVGAWSALLATTYGQLVLIKIVLLVIMLGLAGFNEWQTRRAAASALGLRRGVRLELALGVFVLAVAAMLSGTPPSPSA